MFSKRYIICPNPNFNRQLKILETRGGEKEETRTMTSGDSLVLTRRNYPSGNENFFLFGSKDEMRFRFAYVFNND